MEHWIRDALLLVENLTVEVPLRGACLGRARDRLRVVDCVGLHVARGRTLGLVGESGCGKTTLAKAVLRLLPAAAGRVIFDGQDVLALRGRELRQLRRRMQIVFQDPASSLNPRLRIETIVGEALGVHGLVRTSGQRRRRVAELLERVGLSSDDLDRFPHELSGGQRQRVGIARALALQPELIICDEPTAALDVSIQAQILNLLAELQEQYRLSYLFIAHSLPVVRHISHEVAVMHAGRIVELAETERLFRYPQHPHTRRLLAAAQELRPALPPS